MRYFDVWHGDLNYGIYSETELEGYIWPRGTRFICIWPLP